MEWLAKKPNTFKHHIEHPEIDANQYIQAKRLSLGREIVAHHRIYLDTKQWLQMRDVAIGQARNEIHSEIFATLMSLRSTNKILCPIGYSVFVELMRQSDDRTRHATASVIDQLANGCCCLPPHTLGERELVYFMVETAREMIEKRLGRSVNLPPILHSVWTKPTFVFGETMTSSTAFPAATMSAIQRSMDDLFCSISVEEMIKLLGRRDWSNETAKNEQFVSLLEKGKREHAGDHRTFHELLCAEIDGGLDALHEILESAMVQVAQISGITEDCSLEERRSSGQMLAGLVSAAFRSKKIGKQLAQIHIHSSLHAALRWDKTRKYAANDFEDIRHACVALPYYDVFCTERSLCHLVNQNLLQLDKIYGTKVLASDKEFLAHVKSLAAA